MSLCFDDAGCNYLAMFDALCQKRDDVDQVLKIINDELVAIYGFEMLLHAIQHERLQIISLLLDRYPNLVNTQDDNGYTILYFAVIKNRCESVRHILAHSPQLLRKLDNNERTIFHTVASCDVSLTMLNLLIDCDKNTNGPLYVMDIPDKSSYPVHRAAASSNILFLSRLFAVNPHSLSEFTSNNSTVLHIAVAHDYDECTQYLIQTCPHLCKLEDLNGFNPLHIAVRNRNLKIVKMLVTCDSTIIQSSTKVSVFWFAMERDSKIARMLLRLWPNVVNERYENAAYPYQYLGGKSTTLHAAAKISNCGNLITDLLHAKPDLLHIQDRDGKVALCVANEHTNRNAIEAIIAYCPHLNYMDEEGNTTLHLLMSTNAHKELILDVFNDQPSHMYTYNKKQNTPLHKCIKHHVHLRDTFESLLAPEFTIKVYVECGLDVTQLFSKLELQCNELCLLRELKGIVYQYLGFESSRTKKRQKQSQLATHMRQNICCVGGV